MATASTDRKSGISGSLAIKQPCRVATTEAITLSGLQTIDGVTVVADDRVLVKDQADAVENGIYLASTSAWQRAKDFDGPLDVVKGTFVLVIAGTVAAGKEYQVTTADDITVGTSSITWALRQIYQDLEDAVAAAEAAEVDAEEAAAAAVAAQEATEQALADLQLGDLADVDTTGAATGDGLVFDGTTWEPGPAGGGMFRGNNGTVGSRSGDIFRVNAQTLTEDVTIGATENAYCAGPLTIETGNTLTIATGGRLVIA